VFVVFVRLEDPVVLAALVTAAGLVVTTLIKGIVKLVCTWMLLRKKHRSKKASKRKKSRKATKRKKPGLSESARSPPPY